jgi:hypothetical protein
VHAEGDGWPPKKAVKTTNGKQNSQKVVAFSEIEMTTLAAA